MIKSSKEVVRVLHDIPTATQEAQQTCSPSQTRYDQNTLIENSGLLQQPQLFSPAGSERTELCEVKKNDTAPSMELTLKKSPG